MASREAYDTLGFGSRGGLLPCRLERRWTKDLYDVGVALSSRPQPTPIGPRRVGFGSSRLACMLGGLALEIAAEQIEGAERKPSPFKIMAFITCPALMRSPSYLPSWASMHSTKPI